MESMEKWDDLELFVKFWNNTGLNRGFKKMEVRSREGDEGKPAWGESIEGRERMRERISFKLGVCDESSSDEGSRVVGKFMGSEGSDG